MSQANVFSELEVMLGVANSFFDDQIPPGISSPSGDIDRRMATLHYGYGARTRAVLENNFKGFSKALSNELWVSIGREFSYSVAPSISQMGDIAAAFYQFILKHTDVDDRAKTALDRDWAFIQVRHAYYNDLNLLLDLQQIQTCRRLHFQKSTALYGKSGDYFIVSRDRSSYYERKVSDPISDFYLENKDQPWTLDGLALSLKEPDLLAMFFKEALAACWLSR